MRFLLLILILSLSWCSTLSAAESIFAQLDKLENAVEIAIGRLDSGLLMEGRVKEDFALMAGRQIEFALISLDAADLLEEDYYHLALYLLARRYCYYDLAIELLEFEVKMAQIKEVRNWLREKIREVIALKSASGAVNMSGVDLKIKEEFASLKRVLRKAGAR